MVLKKTKLVLGIVLFFLTINLVCAEKLDIKVQNSYLPGEVVTFRVNLYNNQNQIIDGKIDYVVQDFYSEIVKEGITKSGDEITFTIPQNTVQGPWKITVYYQDIEVNRFFNVGELSKADIKIDGDTLIIQNVGNSLYEKNILIYIGDNEQTASVFLEVGQSKKIKLTAPEGSYDIKIIEGNQKQAIEFEGVGLTGNVVGLESVVGGNILSQYPLVWLFLTSLVAVFIVVSVLKINKKKSKK